MWFLLSILGYIRLSETKLYVSRHIPSPIGVILCHTWHPCFIRGFGENSYFFPLFIVSFLKDLEMSAQRSGAWDKHQ